MDGQEAIKHIKAPPSSAGKDLHNSCGCAICSAHRKGLSVKLKDVVTGKGQGFDPQSLLMPGDRRKKGPSNLIERIELLGCSLTFEFRPVEGTIIHLEVPDEPEGGTGDKYQDITGG